MHAIYEKMPLMQKITYGHSCDADFLADADSKDRYPLRITSRILSVPQKSLLLSLMEDSMTKEVTMMRYERIFWNHTVLTETESVLHVILNELNER